MATRHIGLSQAKHCCLLLLVTTLFIPIGNATPIFQATAQVAGQDIEFNSSNNAASASTGHTDDSEEGVSSGDAFAYVSNFGMGASAHASIQPVAFDHFGETVFGRLSSSAGSSAFVRYFDIMFTGQPGEEGEIAVSTRITLDGVLSAESTPGLSSAAVSVEYGLGVLGPGSTAIADNIGRVVRGYNSETFTPSTTGIFAGIIDDTNSSFDSLFDTPTFNIPLNTMVSLAIELSATASVTTQDGDSVDAFSDFSQTLLLGYGGLVFNLPSGYTASSESLGIVNNQFLSTPPAIDVDAPSAFSLLFGLGLWACLRARKP